MGDYTECYIRCKLINDLDPIVENTLKFLFIDKTKEPKILPNHIFFTLPRWRMLGSCNSYYHIPVTLNSFKFDDISRSYYLLSRSDLKNYDNEIECFFDWLDPYIDELPGEFIGYILTEYNNQPLLVYKKDDTNICRF